MGPTGCVYVVECCALDPDSTPSGPVISAIVSASPHPCAWVLRHVPQGSKGHLLSWPAGLKQAVIRCMSRALKVPSPLRPHSTRARVRRQEEEGPINLGQDQGSPT